MMLLEIFHKVLATSAIVSILSGLVILALDDRTKMHSWILVSLVSIMCSASLLVAVGILVQIFIWIWL